MLIKRRPFLSECVDIEAELLELFANVAETGGFLVGSSAYVHLYLQLLSRRT